MSSLRDEGRGVSMEQAPQTSAHPDAEGSSPASGQAAQSDLTSAEEGSLEPSSGADAAPALSPVMVYARAMLDEQIARLTRQGYVIVSQSETSAQLKRRKHFSVWWALFWLIVGAGVGLLVYVAWYVLIKRDRVAFLRITPEGRIMLTEN